MLPAASFLEFDDLTFSYFHLNIGAQSKAREPMGESLPNQEIFRRLAKAMGFEEPALFESDAAIISQLLTEMRLGCDFSALQRKGWHSLSDTPLIFHEDLTFDTPSGKIEIASDKAEQKGPAAAASALGRHKANEQPFPTAESGLTLAAQRLVRQ